MRLMILLALLLVSGSLSAQTQGAIKRVCHVSRFELAVACIKKYEGLHGPKEGTEKVPCDIFINYNLHIIWLCADFFVPLRNKIQGTYAVTTTTSTQ